MNNKIWEDIKIKFLKSGSPILLIIGVNVAIFLVVSIASVLNFFAGHEGVIQNLVTEYLAFPSSPSLWLTRFYTIITYQFFHANFFHILFNMLWLYWMGQILMEFVKPRQFYFVYIGGGILGAIFYALVLNLIPAYQAVANNSSVIGSSAAVTAILAAAGTLVPDYTIRLMFVGNVKIKYIVLIYILLDIIGTTGYNAGGSLAHLGGAIFGFIYIKIWRVGTDLSAIFKRKPKLRVIKNENIKKQSPIVNQKEVDLILDKISKSGYDKLSKEEKEVLFRASKN